jgi:hypothetical protein
MKTFNLISAIVAAGFTLSSNAANYQFEGVDNSIETKICIAAVTNDKKSLKRKIRISGARVRTIARGLMCNEQIVANFAYKYNALETFGYLDRYTPKKYKANRPSVTIQDITAIHGKTTVVLIASK